MSQRDNTAKIWDLDSNSFIKSFSGHQGWLTCVAIDPKARWIASGGDDKTILIWDMQSGELLHRLLGHSASLTDLAFDQSGDRLVSAADDSTVRIWNAMDGSEIHQWQFPNERILQVLRFPELK